MANVSISEDQLRALAHEIAARHGGVPGNTIWNRYVHELGLRGISADVVYRHYGGFKAMAAAFGMEYVPGKVSVTFTDADCIAWVRCYAEEHSGIVHGSRLWNEWAAQQDGAPASTTIQRHFKSLPKAALAAGVPHKQYLRADKLSDTGDGAAVRLHYAEAAMKLIGDVPVCQWPEPLRKPLRMLWDKWSAAREMPAQGETT